MSSSKKHPYEDILRQEIANVKANRHLSSEEKAKKVKQLNEQLNIVKIDE